MDFVYCITVSGLPNPDFTVVSSTHGRLNPPLSSFSFPLFHFLLPPPWLASSSTSSAAPTLLGPAAPAVASLPLRRRTSASLRRLQRPRIPWRQRPPAPDPLRQWRAWAGPRRGGRVAARRAQVSVFFMQKNFHKFFFLNFF